MRNFLPSEFNDLDSMDPVFLTFLDEVRTLAGMAFYLTSDYRTPEVNAEIGGSQYSLHPKGMAVDFVTKSCRNRDSQAYYADIFKIVWATVTATNTGTPHNRAIQFEIVKGPNDWHLHLGLYPKGAKNDSKIIVALD